MTTKQQSQHPSAGDWIEVHAPAQGRGMQRGQILEVLGRPGHEHYRVRWSDDHESIYYPADGGAKVVPQDAR